MGMPSMTNSAAPLPKLRVTYLSCGDSAPQCAQERSAEVDSDNNEPAAKADFDDDFRGFAIEGDACDDVLDFPSLSVALALLDLPREDDVLEVED